MLHIRISNAHQNAQLTYSGDALVIGRQPAGGDNTVFVDDPYVSRRHLRLEPDSQSTIRILNLGSSAARVAGGVTIDPGENKLLSLPVTITVGRSSIEIAQKITLPQPLGQTTAVDLLRTTVAPLNAGLPEYLRSVRLPAGPPIDKSTPAAETLAAWFETLLSVQRSVVGSAAFYEEIARAIVEIIGLDFGSVLLYENGEWNPKGNFVSADYGSVKHSQSVLNQMLAQKRTLYRVPSKTGSVASLRDIEAVVASPIFDLQQQVVGAVYGSRAVRPHAGNSEIQPLEAQVVQLLAGSVTSGLVRLKNESKLLKYQHEMEIGRQIQTSFLPGVLPQKPGWEIAACFHPAREVSGDFYDAFETDGGRRVGIVIADVCDKGVGSALFMALIRTLMRALSVITWRDMESAIDNRLPTRKTPVEITNDYLLAYHQQTNMFATLFWGLLDTETGELHYVNAGHDPPVIIGRERVRAHIKPTAPAIGMFSNAVFPVHALTIAAGEVLFAYTDGVTEARNAKGKFFSHERLIQLLGQPVSSANALLENVDQKLREHIALADQSDDITMIAVRRGL